MRRFGVRAFEGVSQVNVRAVRGQLRAAVAQSAADAQFRHRVSADHQLESIHVISQRGGLARHSARALLGLNAGEGVLDNAEQIGPGANRRIKGDDTRVGETQRFTQAMNEQVIDQAHLGAYHLDRSVVDAGVLTQLGIINGQEILVEIEPGVIAGSRQRGGRHHRDDAQQQIEGRGDVGAGIGVRQNLQGARQQVVLGGERSLGAFERKRIGGVFAATQQQRKGHGLGVGVGKLIVGCVGKEELPPVPRQLHQGRSRPLEGIGHVVTQHATQGGEQCGKALEINFARSVGGDERLPREKIAQQAFDGVRVLKRGRLAAVGGNVARQTHDPVHRFAVSVERPFVAVGVENVRDGREALELVAVMALEPAGGGTNAGRLDLDVSSQQLVEMHGVIRAPEAVGQGCFTRADDVPA